MTALTAEQDAAPRGSLLLRIGELQAKKLGDAVAAFDAFARAFRDDPGHEGAKLELEEATQFSQDRNPSYLDHAGEWYGG